MKHEIKNRFTGAVIFEAELDARHFPAGTKVLVLLPCCPRCGQSVEFCRSDDGCEFDWNAWIQEQYS